MPEFIPLVVASDANFFFGLQTTVASAVLHERTYPLSVHLLDGGVTDLQWDALVATAAKLNPRTRMTRHRLDPALLANFSERGEFNAMIYARALTPMFVPEPFAVYIDSDFLVSQPLSALLPHLESGKAVGAISEGGQNLSIDCPWGAGMDLSRYLYVNSGFLLLNLDKWRKDNLSESLISFMDKESGNCRYPDQAAINWVLRDEIDYIPQPWNVFANDFDAGVNRAGPGKINLHFASGMKPWKRPLPTVSHRLWWLFNRMFPPALVPSNPVMQPRNLARYLKHLVRPEHRRAEGGPTSRDLLKQWEAFWRGLRDR